MIVFKKLRYKNFLATGNYFNEINLNSHDVTLITGKNGSGKSSGLLDGICYGLFNKGFRHVPKGNFINSINGSGLLVEVEFSVSGKDYLVRRGAKPSVFEIAIDGKALDEVANVRDQQEYLEKNILRLNWKAFTQVVILGSAAHVPFMQLKTGDRREIIEELLDLQSFSVMRNLLKGRMDILKDTLQDLNYEIKNLETKIELEEKYLKRSQVDMTERLERNNESIQETKGLIAEEKKKIEAIENSGYKAESISLNEKLLSCQNSIKKIESYKIKINHKVEHYKKEIDFFAQHSTCPTCEQTITDEWKDLTVNNRNISIQECEDGLAQLAVKLSTLESEKSDILGKIEEIDAKRVKINTYRNSIASYEKFIEKIQCDNDEINKGSQTEIGEESVKENRKIKQDKEREKETLLESKELYTLATALLKDNGIKASIIKQYVPIINHCINNYLSVMDFYVKFELDENFDESMKSRHLDDFKYGNFSEGEKKRIDLSVLFAWRDIAKKKNSMNTNLIILDEVFDSAMDSEGTDAFIKIIKTLTGQNVFIITHKVDQMLDRFDDTNSRVIEFEKRKNFSYIKNETN